MARSLRPYQDIGIDFALAHKRCNIHAGMGLGKTAMVLTALRRTLDGEPALAVAPLRVARGVWPREMQEWDHLRDLVVVPITGDLTARRTALAQPAHLHTINYDNLPWLVEELGGRERWPFRKVFADESTRLKGFRLQQGTARAKALGHVAHRYVDQWINLTGTPAPNGLLDLWGQQWYVDAGAALGRTFDAFKQRWFYPGNAYGDYVKWTPHAHAHDEIVSLMQPSTLTIDPRDWFDVAEPIVNNVYVDLPVKARHHYRSMERKFFASLARGDVNAATAGAKCQKLLQFASGAVYHDDHTWEKVHDEKIEALDSIIQEAAGAPVLVVYEFIHEAARIAEKYPHARQIKRTDLTFEDDWNAGKVPLAFGHPKSFGHGLSLQHGGNTIVYFGQSWDLELYLQALERIGPIRQAQSGYDRPVFVHHIVARDTMDVDVVARRAGKGTLMEMFGAAMKARPA